jgi:hypothetical protein
MYMKTSPSEFWGNLVASIFALGMLVALGWGAYLLLQAVAGFFGQLNQEFAAALVTALLAVLLVPLAIQRAKQARDLARLQFENRAKRYEHFLDVWWESENSRETAAADNEIAHKLWTAQRDLLFWGSAEVLQRYTALSPLERPLDLQDPEVVAAVERLLTALRKDLGHKSIGLHRGDLTSLLDTPRGPIRRGPRGEPH